MQAGAMSDRPKAIVLLERIEDGIHLFRSEKAILYQDLGSLCGVTTGAPRS